MSRLPVFITQIIFLLLISANPSLFSQSVCFPNNCKTGISSINDFFQLSNQIQSGTRSYQIVKILYQRPVNSSEQLYFINTQKFSYHFDFAMTVLKTRYSIFDFNRIYEMESSQRPFNMGSVLYLPAKNDATAKFILEMWSGDTLSIEYLEKFYQILRKKLPQDTVLYYHPLSFAQEQRVTGNLLSPIKVITTAQLYEGEDFQSLNTGVAYGEVKFIDSDNLDNNTCLDQTHIAVFDKVPNDIGLIGGVITEEFQTPLSHINVKSMNRGTINMGLKNALEKLKKYESKTIKLEVGPKGYVITELDPAQSSMLIKSFWESKKPRFKLNPQFDIKPAHGNQFFRFSDMFATLPYSSEHKNMVRTIGAKATNLGLLTNIMSHQLLQRLKFKSPNGYAVPFYFYDLFMQYNQTGIDPTDRTLLTTPETVIRRIYQEYQTNTTDGESICQTKPYLERIRNVILSATVPPAILRLFKLYIIDDPNSPIHQEKVARIRLRSSTNSEDMDGFTGAGLYNSEGISLYGRQNGIFRRNRKRTWSDIRQRLLNTIPIVYSSAWNDRAYEEREWYGLKGYRHFDIKVGIAVHKAFPLTDMEGSVGEVANGVAITENISDPSKLGQIYINAQHFNLAVTNPPNDDDLIQVGADPSQPYSTEVSLVNTFLSNDRENSLPTAWRKWSYSYLSRTSIMKGSQVLHDDLNNTTSLEVMELRRLAKALTFMRDIFANVYRKDPRNFAIDVEWKVYGPDRTFWIKQFRPFSKQAPASIASSNRTDDTAAASFAAASDERTSHKAVEDEPTHIAPPAPFEQSNGFKKAE